jgi:hypothetical protein
MFMCCANSKCNLPRKSFSDGRLFQFEIVSISVAASDESSEPFDEKPERDIAHFWLCDDCASKMSLELDPRQGLRLIPLKNSEGERRSLPPVGHGKVQPRNHC